MRRTMTGVTAVTACAAAAALLTGCGSAEAAEGDGVTTAKGCSYTIK